MRTQFVETVSRLDLHGLHFQHVSLCQRRAWLHLHSISFAQWNRHVAKGLAMHDTSYRRDKSVTGLFGLRPDRIDWDNRLVLEDKSSGSHLEASMVQVAFYALMLSVATGETWSGLIQIAGTKRKHVVVLDEPMLTRLQECLRKLEHLADSLAPDAVRTPVCKGCSYAEFCEFSEGNE